MEREVAFEFDKALNRPRRARASTGPQCGQNKLPLIELWVEQINGCCLDAVAGRVQWDVNSRSGLAVYTIVARQGRGPVRERLGIICAVCGALGGGRFKPTKLDVERGIQDFIVHTNGMAWELGSSTTSTNYFSMLNNITGQGIGASESPTPLCGVMRQEGHPLPGTRFVCSYRPEYLSDPTQHP